MKTINKLIKEQIKKEQEYLKEHNAILDMLKPLEGKQLNFRTFNKKTLKGFELVSNYGMFYIKGNFDHLIGYSSSELVSIENFKRLDTCHGFAAQKRINQLKDIDAKELQKISNKINKAFNELRFLFGEIESKNLGSFNNPIYYEMLRNIYKSENGSSSGIELSNFYYIRQ